MRTTNTMMFHSVQSRIARVEEMRAKFLAQISSGNRISTPSDDPVGISKVMNYSSEKVRISQFGRNMTEGSSWLTATDHAMNETVDVFMRANTLLLAAANDTLSDDNLKAQAGELEKMLESLVSLGNTNNAGSYIFAGHQSRTSPYNLMDGSLGAVSAGDDGEREIEVGVNQKLAINTVGGGYTLDGREIKGFFKADQVSDADGRDAFQLLSQTIAELRSATSRDYRTSSNVDPGVTAELASGDLTISIQAADGSGGKSVAVAGTHHIVGGGNAVQRIANNAWDINDSMAQAVSAGVLTNDELVTASLRTQVQGNVLTEPGGTETLAAGNLTINGTAIGPISLQQVGSDEQSALVNVREIASRINERSSKTGVWATYKGSGTSYQLVLKNMENGSHGISDSITIKATDNAVSWTGLGFNSVAGPDSETAVYHAGAYHAGPPVSYDSINADLPGSENHTVYNSNNGTITFTSPAEFSLRENNAGVLSSTLGLEVNDGVDTHEASTVNSGRLLEVQRYLAYFEGQLATVGARMNHIDRSVDTFEQRTIDLKSFIADIKEVDISAAIMNYNSAQNAYEATLAASARVYSTTILDYLT
ncbi:MAG: flagellar hook-associated protein FlgL [Dissulfuribacterales bacterium]